MKLRESQRSKIAERICARWIARRKTRIRRPKVYLIAHPTRGSLVWGWCHHGNQPFITLHTGPTANRRDVYILLAHEFAHTLEWQLFGKFRRRRERPHGEQFQRLLWGTVPRGLWKRAGQERWVKGRSAHQVKFQPD